MTIITTIDCNKYSGIVTSKGSLGFEHSPQTGSLLSDKIHNKQKTTSARARPHVTVSPQGSSHSAGKPRTRVIYNIK